MALFPQICSHLPPQISDKPRPCQWCDAGKISAFHAWNDVSSTTFAFPGERRETDIISRLKSTVCQLVDFLAGQLVTAVWYRCGGGGMCPTRGFLGHPCMLDTDLASSLTLMWRGVYPICHAAIGRAPRCSGYVYYLSRWRLCFKPRPGIQVSDKQFFPYYVHS